jgi:hypothetical protein
VGHALADAPQLAYAQLLGDDLVELCRDSGTVMTISPR